MSAAVNATAGDWNGTTHPLVLDTMASTDVDNSTVFPDASSTVPPHPHDSIWLMSASAQGIAGVFVWAAVFITCHQVCYHCCTATFQCHTFNKLFLSLADISVSEVLHSSF